MKIAYKLLVLMLSVLLLGSCRLTTFTAAPGSPRVAFPVEMQGNYMAVEKHKGGKDTFTLEIKESQAITNDQLLGRFLNLSDSTTLTHLGDFYFYSIRHTNNGHFIWWTFPVLVKHDCLYVFSLSQGRQQKKMEKYIKLTGNASGEYLMDNEPFKNYCEKHLKKRKAFKLKRIK